MTEEALCAQIADALSVGQDAYSAARLRKLAEEKQWNIEKWQ